MRPSCSMRIAAQMIAAARAAVLLALEPLDGMEHGDMRHVPRAGQRKRRRRREPVVGMQQVIWMRRTRGETAHTTGKLADVWEKLCGGKGSDRASLDLYQTNTFGDRAAWGEGWGLNAG